MTTVPNQRTSTEDQGGLAGFSTDELNFIWQRLDASQREFITLYYNRARKLNKQATDAWNKRAYRLQFLLEYCEVNGYTDHNTREKILNDWAFNDANDDWLRFSREIKRCEAAIAMELKMGLLIRTEAPSAG